MLIIFFQELKSSIKFKPADDDFVHFTMKSDCHKRHRLVQTCLMSTISTMLTFNDYICIGNNCKHLIDIDIVQDITLLLTFVRNFILFLQIFLFLLNTSWFKCVQNKCSLVISMFGSLQFFNFMCGFFSKSGTDAVFIKSSIDNLKIVYTVYLVHKKSADICHFLCMVSDLKEICKVPLLPDEPK